MRRVEVAELVLLAAAFAVGLLLAAALLLHYCRRCGSTTKPCSELPLSRPSCPATKQSCRRRLIHLLMLCSGNRRARVEPASANSAEASPPSMAAAAVEVEDVARWRERWFGPASRALYTIDEDDEECSTDEERPPEPETPFYTPPASPTAA